MKTLTSLLCLTFAASVFAAEDPAATKTENEGVVVTVSADEYGNMHKDVKVIRIDNGETIVADDGSGGHAVFVRAMTEGGDDSAPQIRVRTNVNTVDENRGWLGVALQGTTSDDGTTENSTVVVDNVVKGSPAETAGLKRGDVVMSVNGTTVEDGVAGLAKSIGDLGPGTDATFTIVRDGETMDITATLAAPQAGGIEWHHLPNATFTDKFRTHKHIGKLTPQGNVQILELKDLDNLPDALANIINQTGTSVQVAVNDGNRILEIENNENGEVTRIHQEGDGLITVSRFAEGAEDDAVVDEYDDAAALEAADADAYALYAQQEDRTANVWIDDNGQAFNFNFNVGINEDAFELEDLHEHLMNRFEGTNLDPDTMAEAHEAIQRALGGMNWHVDTGSHFMFAGKASRTFKVQPNGNIEQTVRKGDTEIVTVFTDEADLEARDPEAFDRYQDVMNADLGE